MKPGSYQIRIIKGTDGGREHNEITLDSGSFDDSEFFVTFVRECSDFLPDDVVEGMRRAVRGEEMSDDAPTV